MGFENLLLGFGIALQPHNLGVAVLGITLGTIIGVLPGLGGANGVAILLPLTFSMHPTSAIILLTSLYWGALFGGAITSILFNIPGEPWSVGIRHPRLYDQMIETIRVSDTAVCTSGDYERRDAGFDGGAHILNSRLGQPATGAVSVTVIAPSAMLADALATAAFVLGPEDGLSLLERAGVEGLIYSPSIDRFATKGFPHA